MSERLSRRAVMARVLLMAAPVELSTPRDRDLTISFATAAELRAWLDAEGLSGPNLPIFEHTGELDGKTYRDLLAYPEGWHGWHVYASATEYIDPAPLDNDTTTSLTAVAGGAR